MGVQDQANRPVLHRGSLGKLRKPWMFGYCSNCLVKTTILYSLPMKYIKEAYEKRVLNKHDDVKFNTLDGNKNENRANEE